MTKFQQFLPELITGIALQLLSAVHPFFSLIVLTILIVIWLREFKRE